jgi:hypothetical protein|tara:strand:+ start:365 stop:592 length:228 start_codon:yes stop_codon:yes gene_type:complete
MPKSNYSLPHEKIQRELAVIKTDLTNIKKQVKDLSIEQRKLIAYANMGRGGLKVIIGIGFLLAGLFSIGFFIGQR